MDWWFLDLTAASVPDVGCVPSPRSLDASVAGFYKLVLLYGCAASVLNAGRVPSPCSLDDSVAGFSTLALPPPCAMQRGASLTVCCQSSASAVLRRRVPSLDALPGFYAGFDCASRVAVLLCVQPLSTIGV